MSQEKMSLSKSPPALAGGSGFQHLPPEVLIKIFTPLLSAPRPLLVNERFQPLPLKYVSKFVWYQGFDDHRILRTCRIFYKVGRELFFRLNTFVISATFKELKRVRKSGSLGFSEIRSVILVDTQEDLKTRLKALQLFENINTLGLSILDTKKFTATLYSLDSDLQHSILAQLLKKACFVKSEGTIKVYLCVGQIRLRLNDFRYLKAELGSICDDRRKFELVTMFGEKLSTYLPPSVR